MTKQEFFEGSDPRDLETQRLLEYFWNNKITPEELENGILGSAKHSLKEIITYKSFEEISNEYALESPFGKESLFYIPRENSFRKYLEQKREYANVKNIFKGVDLENINHVEVYDSINIKYK